MTGSMDNNEAASHKEASQSSHDGTSNNATSQYDQDGFEVGQRWPSSTHQSEHAEPQKTVESEPDAAYIRKPSEDF